MSRHCVIFIGRSGSGKGTQAKLLSEEISRRTAQSVFSVGTGEELRKFWKGNTISSKRSLQMQEQGLLQPEFVVVHMWGHALINNYNGEDHLFFDGTPRKLHEAQVLESALKFYEIESPVVLNIDVSDDWARERLMSRGRSDDDIENINNRLSWFSSDVVPALEWYRNKDFYSVFDINGEQPIEAVHQDIMSALFPHE